MSEDASELHERTAVILANLGLIPFIVLTLMSFLQLATGFAIQTMLLYSLSVLCFLAGSWWGFSLGAGDASPRDRTGVIVASSGLTLFAIAAMLVLTPAWTIFVFAALYILLIVGERQLPGVSNRPPWYHAVRRRVSIIAAGTHLLFGWAISAI